MKIGIVGAGIIGRLLALLFSSNGHRVTLFDRDTEGIGGASFVAGGMISPYCELESSALLIHELGKQSLEMWPSILQNLDIPVFFQKAGSLVIAHPHDLPELERFRSKITSVIGERGFRDLSSAGIGALEPDLDERFVSGMFFPFEGQIHPQEFFFATTQAFQKDNVECVFGTVVEAVEPHQVTCLRGEFHFDAIIDCRGVGAQQELPDLRAVRGESILLEAPNVHLTRPVRMMHPRYPLYVVPRLEGKFFIGATQIESGSTESISVRSVLELLSSVYSIQSGFSEARILQTSIGLRPTFPHHQPRIQFKDRMVRVNGLYRHGYLVGPKIAELVFNFILKDKIPDIYSTLFREESSNANMG